MDTTAVEEWVTETHSSIDFGRTIEIRHPLLKSLGQSRESAEPIVGLSLILRPCA